MTPSDKRRNIWIACAIVVACVIIGLVIWKTIVVH